MRFADYLGKRGTGKYDRVWLPSEIERCYALASLKGNTDAGIAMDFMPHFGLRIGKTTLLKLTYLKRTLNYGQLMVTGKGGKYPTDYLICDKKCKSEQVISQALIIRLDQFDKFIKLTIIT